MTDSEAATILNTLAGQMQRAYDDAESAGSRFILKDWARTWYATVREIELHLRQREG